VTHNVPSLRKCAAVRILSFILKARRPEPTDCLDLRSKAMKEWSHRTLHSNSHSLSSTAVGCPKGAALSLHMNGIWHMQPTVRYLYVVFLADNQAHLQRNICRHTQCQFYQNFRNLRFALRHRSEGAELDLNTLPSPQSARSETPQNGSTKRK
jgi:hypothetical protein